MHDLEEHRQVGDGAEHRKTDDEADDARDRERADGEQVQWQHRFCRTPLHKGEDNDEHRTSYAKGDDRDRGPPVRRATEACEEHEAGRGENENGRPEIVDDMVDSAQVARNLAGDNR